MAGRRVPRPWFPLASTAAAPEINTLLSGIVHQAQAWLSGGKG